MGKIPACRMAPSPMFSFPLQQPIRRMQAGSASGLWRVAAPLLVSILGAACTAGSTPAHRSVPSAQAGPPDRLTSSFRREVLDDRVTRAHALDVAADGSVYFIEREGAVKVWEPETRRTRMVGYIPVKAIHTSGLLGIALDPDFERNGWVYVYYSPYNDTENLLARYTIRDGSLLPESRVVLLEVPLERQVEGGHSAGYLNFGPEGALYLSTGDNTSPRGHGWGPIDERPGREIYDAQRASANTWDLRGKILRILPTPEGGYEVPPGNLFPFGSQGRPEIYVMGTRNPFRFSVDPATGWVYWGDVGPDAATDDPDRGPAGHDEFNQAREPGNFGWPHFVADNRAYRRFDFEAGTAGPAFEVERPINASPNNTGARVLPPARPAMIWYPYLASETFPSLGTGGRSAMAGPVFRPARTHRAGAFPAGFDGSLFIFDFMRHWIQEVRFDEEGEMVSVRPFLEEMEFVRPIAMDLGPDGALYLIEWGTSYEGWNNDDARLVRIAYAGPGAGSGAVIDSAPPSEPIRRAEVGEGLTKSLRFAWPLPGGVVDLDRPIPYRIVAAEGGEAAPGDVRARGLLGHDAHTHGGRVRHGPVGALAVTADETHLYMEDHFAALEGWRGEPRAGEPEARVRLQPRRLEAEHAYSFAGATRRVQGSLRERIDVRVRLRVGEGGFARYGPIDLRNIDGIRVAAAPLAGGVIEVRTDGVGGPLLARLEVAGANPPPGPGQAEPGVVEVRAPLRDPGGPHEIFLVFRGAAGESLMDVDWIEFEGPGMMQDPGN